MSASHICSICGAVFHNSDAFRWHMEDHEIRGEGGAR
jgi:hypothetical protein